MSKAALARELQLKSKYKMSIETILRRLRNGWSDDKILTTPVQRKPPSNHPLKRPCFKVIAARKGWKV